MANFSNPNFNNPQFNNPQFNNPQFINPQFSNSSFSRQRQGPSNANFNSQPFNDPRLGTPSPLGAGDYQNDRNQHNLSPTSHDAYFAGSGRTPLNPPFDPYDNSPFPRNGAAQLPNGSQPEPPAMASDFNDQPGGLGFAHEDEDMLANPDVKWRAVAKPMRLGRVTVMCLIFNRMIGTGIFRTPATVYNFTQSIGISMAWWGMGVVAAMSGIIVYMELGHTIPIYRFGDRDVSVPRNGGELNYLKYIYRKPAFFTTCVFGLSFILLGHVAMNGIQFGISILDAAGKENIANHDNVVRGIAISISFGACFLHGTWRQGGLALNNILALFKIGVLTLIFILGMCAVGGAFPRASANAIGLAAPTNFLESTGTANWKAYGYAEAFLAILFAFGGFNQANYVIGEIDDPRRRYKWPAFTAVALVSILYLLDNAAYFIVVPEQLFNPSINPNLTVAHYLFIYTIGTRPGWEDKAPQMLSAFIAISCLGNIIVMTYTAARVKQEIAKEGILPFRQFLAGSVKARIHIPISKLWGSKKETLPEDVPLGALVLHFTVSTILICATWKQRPGATYSMLVDLYSYTVDAVFGSFLGFGLLFMRFFSKRNWAAHVRRSGFDIPGYISAIAATIFGLANLYPVAAKWIPIKGALAARLTVPWYVTGTVGWIILFLGVLWWIGFRYIIPRFGRDRVGRVLIVIRKLWFREEDGYKVLEFEDVEFRWAIIVADQEGRGGDSGEKVDGWAGGRLRERTYNAGEQETAERMQDTWGPAALNPNWQGAPHEMAGGVLPMHQRQPWGPQAPHHELQAPGATPRL